MATDPSTVVTIIADAQLDGENGLYKFYFSPYNQYEFTNEEVRFRSIDETIYLDVTGQEKIHVNHFKIESSDGLDYCWLSSDYAVVENKLRTAEQQDRRLWEENIVVDQPRDIKQVYKDISGQDLNDKYISMNGYSMWEEAKRNRLRHNGKKYGETIPKT